LAAVAAGATVAAGQTLVGGVSGWAPTTAESPEFTLLAAQDAGLVQSTSPEPKHAPATVLMLKHGPTRQTPELAVMDQDTDVADVQSLTKAVAVGEQLARGAKSLSAALAATASGPVGSLFGGHQFVRPAAGVFTSGFGSRWGTTHYGIDIANKIGTPIYAVTDGTVIESGPASGFGLWIRIKHAGGFISVYGHINRSFVHAGQVVKAGQQIAEIGNRGQSTGPHLHLEIWDPSGRKINPLPWLAARGIRIIGTKLDPR
jgi:murein DD-endopeptidase MepM/ murein hydrolase activator NlpD